MRRSIIKKVTAKKKNFFIAPIAARGIHSWTGAVRWQLEPNRTWNVVRRKRKKYKTKYKLECRSTLVTITGYLVDVVDVSY